MENLNKIISVNLKRIRKEKKLSLDNLAELTGVSKSMLGQIERGESSPTITTIWKIANGLKMSFSSILSVPQDDTTIVNKDELDPAIENGGKYKAFPMFPYEDGRRFEVFTIEIEKGGYLSAEAHIQGATEMITVFEGEITIRVDNNEYTVTEGNGIKFRADKPHDYHNSGGGITKLNTIIYYPE